jgi:hypothetical protein
MTHAAPPRVLGGDYGDGLYIDKSLICHVVAGSSGARSIRCQAYVILNQIVGSSNLLRGPDFQCGKVGFRVNRGESAFLQGCRVRPGKRRIQVSKTRALTGTSAVGIGALMFLIGLFMTLTAWPAFFLH